MENENDFKKIFNKLVDLVLIFAFSKIASEAIGVSEAIQSAVKKFLANKKNPIACPECEKLMKNERSNKSLAGANVPTEIPEQFDSKKVDTEQTIAEAVCNENIDEGKLIKIEDGEERAKPLIKKVSIVDQMLESLVTKYTTPATQPVPTQPQTTKTKPKEIVKETKQVLNLNSSLALDLNGQGAGGSEDHVPRLKFSVKNGLETKSQIDTIDNFDENANDGLEKAPESILWKPICTDENISEKDDKAKAEEAVANKADLASSSKHKKKKKNKDKNKSKEKDKEKKHKKKSEKDKSDNDEEAAKKKEDKKLKKLLKKQKKKMEKAATLTNAVTSGPDTSAIASSFTTTVETSQILLDHDETKKEIEPQTMLQQSPQDLSMKPKKTLLNTNSTSTPINAQKASLNLKQNEPKLPKLKLKLNASDASAKPRASSSQDNVEPLNFSTPQQTSSQRPVSQSAQRINPQPKTSRPVNMNQSMPSRDIELGEVVQSKTVAKNPPSLVKQKSQLSNAGSKAQTHEPAKQAAKPQQQAKNAPQQPKKDAQKVRPSTSNNSNQSNNQFSHIHQDQILFQEALAQEVQNALAQEALAREALLQEAYNNPQLLPLILPLLQAQNQVMNPQFDLNALIAQASLQTLTTSQILEAQQLTQQQMAAQYGTTSTNPNKKRKTMDMEAKSQNTSLNRSQNKPKSSQSLDQSMKRNDVSQQEYVHQDFVNFQHDESALNPVDEANEYKWHQMRVKQEEESLLEQVHALNMSRLTPAKKNSSFSPNVNSTPDAKKRFEANDQMRKNSAMKIIGQVVQETEIASNQYWSCPACAKSDESAPMIACDSCDDWYHWQCVGLTEEPPKNQNWYCHKCGAKGESRNELEVDVESYEPVDACTPLPTGLVQGQPSAPSDYLSNLKIKKKKK
ncbi:transcription initiation factor TFIID subunit 3 [Brachionus plicatilis]|uniref:Transcription initiation factor TFIID subunit 3 n=1 Tax=Brachionus plicatilis TaxID=10195 RepID=A0A3M7SHK1_BRAPC|nr:transcription initiation factor TFIID subunit 3 [Brachionus plicatilis]